MALAIEYEKACQRRHYRVTAPLYVTIDDEGYRASDWSVGGLRIEEFEGELPAIGELVKVQITLPFQDFKITFDAELEVVRHIIKNNGFGAKFTVLGEREQNLMTHFIDEIVRGSMSDVKDTIVRMDMPLTPVSTKPTPQSLADIPAKRRWASKSVLVPALYGLLGLFVFGYTGFVAYANVFHLVVESAVIGGRVGVVKSQYDGEIVYRGVVVGQGIKRGEVIAQIEDPVLEARIDKALIEIKRKQVEVTYLQEEAEDATARMKEYALLQSGDIKNKKQDIANLVGQVNHAKAKHGRLLVLLKRGLTRRKQVDDSKAYLLRLESNLAKSRSSLYERNQFLQRNNDSAVYDGKRIIDGTASYSTKLQFIMSEVELAREDYKILVKQREQKTIRAPYDARVIDLPKYTNSTVIRGDVLVILEPSGVNVVTAYLTQEEILRVKIGDKASVFVPALDKSVDAYIKSINRGGSFVNQKDERYTWRPKEQRNAEVILEITDADLADVDLADGQRFTTGLPAIIMFKDRDNNTILSYILPGFFKSKV